MTPASADNAYASGASEAFVASWYSDRTDADSANTA